MPETVEELKKELLELKKKILEGVKKEDLWFYVERVVVLESIIHNYSRRL